MRARPRSTPPAAVAAAIASDGAHEVAVAKSALAEKAADLADGGWPPQLTTICAVMQACRGMSALPSCRIFFLPSFSFSRSLRLRVMSPP